MVQKLGRTSLLTRNWNWEDTVTRCRLNGHRPYCLLIVWLKVRVLSGSPKLINPEPLQGGVEQFLEMLRFDQRNKLEELLDI